MASRRSARSPAGGCIALASNRGCIVRAINHSRPLSPTHSAVYNNIMSTAVLPLATAAPPLPAMLDYSTDDFHAWLAERGQPPLRARQARRWILAGRADSFSQMTDLPRDLR